jgi:hypothetical protein
VRGRRPGGVGLKSKASRSTSWPRESIAAAIAESTRDLGPVQMVFLALTDAISSATYWPSVHQVFSIDSVKQIMHSLWPPLGSAAGSRHLRFIQDLADISQFSPIGS